MLKTDAFRTAVCFINVWVCVLLVSGQVACTTKKHAGGTPAVQVAKVLPRTIPPDPVPKVEPRSRYGNPASYTVFGKRYYTLTSSQGFTERGIASWYGDKFHGRRTSSGETYDMYAMTAAHTRLPLPTYVQVTNLENGKQVVVRVNDRGPFHQNRVIDLSYSAARKLDIVTQGTGLVEIRALDPLHYRLSEEAGHSPARGTDAKEAKVAAAGTELSGQYTGRPRIFVQVGAFSERAGADQMLNQLRALELGTISISTVMKNTQELHRVRIGPLPTVQSADAMFVRLTDMGMREHKVVID